MHSRVDIRQWVLRNPAKIAITVLLATAIAFVAAGFAPTDQQLAIRNICNQALIADQTLNVPRSSATPGRLTVSMNSAQTSDTAPISDAEEQQMGSLVTTTYLKYYTGSLLQQKIQTLKNSIHHYKTGNVRYLGGGVASMSFSSVVVNGNTATAEAAATVWTKVAQEQGNGKLVIANPHNTVLMTYSLTQHQGQWYIINEQWSFAPGSEP